MLKADALLTPAVEQGVRAELLHLRQRYVTAHEHYGARAAQFERAARDAYQDADCALVMISKINALLEDLPLTIPLATDEAQRGE